MSYIDGNLLAGEKVVYRTRLHWLLFMGPVLLTVVILLPIAWFLYNGPWSSLTWIPLVLGLLVLLATFIKRQSSDFAVTNKRVMMKVGVFSTRSVELLLSKIEAIAVNQSFIGRIFGYGDIVVTGSGGTRELEFRKIDGGSGCPDPPSSTLSLSYLAIVLVHSKLAKTMSFGVGTNGAASTFDAAALAISVGASDGSRKRCWTATFTARVTTQT